MLNRVEEIRHDKSRSTNRLGVLLGNVKCTQTKTLTHVLWSLLNSIPANSVQRPHRHNSVALDLCVSASPGVYTLMGREIDSNGYIIDPIRCDWTPGGVFVTPPGYWHSHHNESDEVAWVLPIQDAGLYTHQRTLDIRFVDDELALHHSGRIRGSAFVVSDDQFTKMKELSAQVPRAASYDTEVITDDASTVVIDEVEVQGEMEDTIDEEEEKKEEYDGRNNNLGKTAQRRASIQVGSLAREKEVHSISSFKPMCLSKGLRSATTGGSYSSKQHRRRKSIQVGADLEYLKKISHTVISF